jgi:hypothetical protein
MQTYRLQIADCGLRILKTPVISRPWSRSAIQTTDHGNSQWTSLNPQSAICNPKSVNPQSAICNPKSVNPQSINLHAFH